MGLFDFFKNKAKKVIEKAHDFNEDDSQTFISDKEEKVKIKNAGKSVNGVPYPKAWENLSDDDILKRILDVQLEIESAESEDHEDQILEENGFHDASHFEDFRSGFQQDLADKRGISIMQLSADTSKEYREETLNNNITQMQSEGGVLNPVDGISVEEWAKVNAKILGGANKEEAITSIGCDGAKWDQVDNEWQTRMANDTTFTIAQIYSKAFNASSDTGDINENNFPYEKYLEIMVAQDMLVKQGKDAQEILSGFGLTVSDWSNVSAFWMQKYQENVDFYYNLDIKLRPQLEEKYQAEDNNTDIEF